MSKTCSRFQFATLDLDELDQVTGGRGIFESLGPSTGWYSAKAGKGLDIGSQIALSAVPYAGTVYGVAQGAWDTYTTAVDYSHGNATVGDVVIAAVGLIPGGAFVHGLGTAAESALGHLITGGTMAGQELAKGLLKLGDGNTSGESHSRAGTDQSTHPNAPGDNAQNAVDQTVPGSGGHDASADRTTDASADHSTDASADHNTDASADHNTDTNADHSTDYKNDADSSQDGQGYFGNDFGDFGGGDFGGGGFGGSDFA